MDHYVGIDVSLELSSVCVLNTAGQIVREAKVASEPEALMLAIHPNARTTPAVRAEIARSAEPTGVLAGRYGVSTETVRNSRRRGSGDGAITRRAATGSAGRRSRRSAGSSPPCGARSASRSAT